MLDLKVIKRNGEVAEFDAERIAGAIGKAVSATGVAIPEIQVLGVAERVCEDSSRFFVATDHDPLAAGDDVVGFEQVVLE